MAHPLGTQLGITQDGLPPFTMTCRGCGESWDPAPVSQGPTAGQHTEHSLDKSANDHRCKETP